MTILLGPLTAVAIGDAYGAGFEFMPKDCIGASNDGLRYFQHTMEPRSPAGCYSDDTQYALAVARVLVGEFGGYILDIGEVNAAPFDQAFVDSHLRDPRGGSPRMMALMRRAHAEGLSLTELLADDQRATSGAAMRATPCGITVNSVEAAMSLAYTQGRISHDVTGACAAAIVAGASFLLSYGECNRAEVRQRLAYVFHAGDWKREIVEAAVPILTAPAWHKRAGNWGVDCASAALTAVEKAASLRDLLVRCVAFSGDVDTVGAIAMGMAWNCRDLPNDLPDSLWDGLEDGRYGRSYLRELELKLMRNGFCQRPLPLRVD